MAGLISRSVVIVRNAARLLLRTFGKMVCPLPPTFQPFGRKVYVVNSRR
jgi:hypothetical protein